MTRAFAICLFLGSTAACGGRPLDLGGVRNADAGGPLTPLSTAIITQQRNAASLQSEGAYIYWTTNDGTAGDQASEIIRCRKDDCAATRQTLFRTRDVGRLLVRHGQAYFRHNGGIVGCHVDDCVPWVVIAIASAAPSIVDDMYVYWSSAQDNALLSCRLDGCDEPNVAVRGVGPIVDAAVDEAHLFWTVWESATEQGIRSTPKYGTPTSGNKVMSQPVISSFALDDAFAYWGQNLSNAQIARTRKTIPISLEPHTHILASGQYYPHGLAIDYDVLFWMNETVPEAQLDHAERPVKIVSCILPACETSIDVLDEAPGGSLTNPRDTYLGGGMLVVDAEAIYYIGDVARIGTSPNGVASIRRLQRRPDR